MTGSIVAYGLDQRAVRVCERAYDAWFARYGSGNNEAALSVIAAFMLADRIDEKALLASTDEQIVTGIGQMWAWFWLRRPDLCNLCGPLANWLNDDPPSPDLTRAAAAMARAAVKAGIGQITADGHLADVDLLGHAYMAVRTAKARAARGEFYTPPNLCYMMAKMLLTGRLEPGMSIAEPAAGTGGMVRAAAQVLREQGGDPADFWWYVNDVSPPAVAALAVNCHVWGIGRRIVIGVADSLAEPGWPDRAWDAQQAAWRRHEDLVGGAAMIALLRNAGALAGGLAEPAPGPGRGVAPPGAPPGGDPDVTLPPGDGALFGLDDVGAPAPAPARPGTGGIGPAPPPPRRRPRRPPGAEPTTLF